MALLPAAVAATALGAVALVGGIAATSTAAPTSAPAAAVAALDTTTTTTTPTLGRGWYARLNPTQRACLDKATISRTIGPRTDAEKAARQEQIRAAATACGITLPSGERKAKALAWWNALSSTQQGCLKKANLTRPIGPLSADQRKVLHQQIVSAAKTCDVTLPKLGKKDTNPSTTPAPPTTSAPSAT